MIFNKHWACFSALLCVYTIYVLKDTHARMTAFVHVHIIEVSRLINLQNSEGEAFHKLLLEALVSNQIQEIPKWRKKNRGVHSLGYAHNWWRSCYQTIRFIYFIIQIFLWFHPLVSNITIHIGACFYWHLVQPVGVGILTVNSLDLDIFDWCGGPSPTGSGSWVPYLSVCRVQACHIISTACQRGAFFNFELVLSLTCHWLVFHTIPHFHPLGRV